MSTLRMQGQDLTAMSRMHINTKSIKVAKLIGV